MNKLMKLCLLMVLTLLCITPIYALETSHVKDHLNYLSDAEISTLQKTIEDQLHTRGMDAVIIITDDVEGKSPADFADDYYDDNNYGLDAQNSGLLLLVDMKERDIYISTTGLAINIFTDQRINTMLDRIATQLTQGDYMKACTIFLDDAIHYVRQENITFSEKLVDALTNPFVYLIPLLITAGVTGGMAYYSKNSFANSSSDYEIPDSFKVHEARDRFSHKTVSKVRIQSNSSGGSGSSTHTSSSGTKHGGGGRKF